MKTHYPILDGLRGIAAVMVVIYHLFEAYYPVVGHHPTPHGYLAVDFFFMLSGFVIGYAYDDRWATMNLWEFFKIRLIRLHPLVFLGVFIGAVGFYFDPYTHLGPTTGLLKILGVTLIGFTLLPSPDIRGWGETHCLDGPCWSLFQEYLANVLYAIWVRKFSTLGLWILVIITGSMLFGTSIWNGNLGTGWGFDNFWIAIVRMLFPFFGGLLLFRSGMLIKIPYAFIFCSLALIIVFSLPTIPYTGFYEPFVVIFIFPLIVSAGAGGIISGNWEKVCDFTGKISYPIYIIHYPFIYIYTSWIDTRTPNPKEIIPIAIGLFFLFILLAWASLKFYDEPIRAWLKKRFILNLS